MENKYHDMGYPSYCWCGKSDAPYQDGAYVYCTQHYIEMLQNKLDENTSVCTLDEWGTLTAQLAASEERVKGWGEDARRYAQNADHWHNRLNEAEAENTRLREGLREVRDTAFSLNSDRWKAIRCSEIAHSLLERKV